MAISRYAVTVGTLVLGLAIPPSAEAQFGRSVELACSGTVTYRQLTIPDQVTLKVSNRDVEVSGLKGIITTFQTKLPYKICSESQNELDFEFSTAEKCGSSSTRFGRLNKDFSNLRLSRSDQGQPYVGNYKCEPTQGVFKK